MGRLMSVPEPAKKREIFRQEYFAIIAEYAKEHDLGFIAQGTQLHHTNSKQYHNEPSHDFLSTGITVIEPLAGLTKKDIRVLARFLDVPEETIMRKPFPGPGLLLRFGGSYSPTKLTLIRSLTACVDSFMYEHQSVFQNCYQFFPYLVDGTPVTYVNGEGKGALGSIVLIRSLSQESIDSELSYWPFSLSNEIESQLVAALMKIDGVARVCFDLTPKSSRGSYVAPGGTIEYI